MQYQERMLPYTGQGARFGQQWAIDLQLTQFYTEADLGTVGRLRGNTIGSLRGITDQRPADHVRRLTTMPYLPLSLDS